MELKLRPTALPTFFIHSTEVVSCTTLLVLGTGLKLDSSSRMRLPQTQMLSLWMMMMWLLMRMRMSSLMQH